LNVIVACAAPWSSTAVPTIFPFTMKLSAPVAYGSADWMRKTVGLPTTNPPVSVLYVNVANGFEIVCPNVAVAAR